MGEEKVYGIIPVVRSGVFLGWTEELLAPYIGLTILLAVAVMAVGYVKKKKEKYRD